VREGLAARAQQAFSSCGLQAQFIFFMRCPQKEFAVDDLHVHIIYTEGGVSKIREGYLDQKYFTHGMFAEEFQNMLPAERKGAHNAAPDAEGPVAYCQLVLYGDFSVTLIREDHQDDQVETFHGGDIVIFQDDTGLGHSSVIGHSGCRRWLRKRRGHIDFESLAAGPSDPMKKW